MCVFFLSRQPDTQDQRCSYRAKKEGQSKDEVQLSLLFNAIRQLFIFTLGWN